MTSLLLRVRFIHFLQRTNYKQLPTAKRVHLHRCRTDLFTLAFTASGDSVPCRMIKTVHFPAVTRSTWKTRVFSHARNVKKKQSLILIALKCHKYEPKALIFYGNRKSICRHQSHPSGTRDWLKHDRLFKTVKAQLHVYIKRQLLLFLLLQ